MSRNRLIPAHAGKTCQDQRGLLVRPAHPRSRGENDRQPRITRAEEGSSPLTRGKHQHWPDPDLRHRLIPAHAGKTTPSPSPPRQERAHPRSRGENGSGAASRMDARGSSPLTRGKLGAYSGRADAGRLIPAHAGKTRGRPRHPRGGGAHPRSRGENEDWSPWGCDARGSSPLTRGKRSENRHRPRRPRLIPAHAGKTRERGWMAGLCAAHPRSRGENPVMARGDGRRPGSSPLTRGKRVSSLPVSSLGGLIPAHAGKTRCCVKSWRRSWAHPRSRGENEYRV